MRRHLIALAALLAPTLGLAGGYSVPNVNPRDLAMAGSLVAAQDSAAAVFGNPAALARLEGLSLSLAASAIDFSSNWTPAPGQNQVSGAATSTETKFATPPALYVSYGGRLASPSLGWGVGAGLTIPGGGNVFWPQEWPGRFDIITVDRRIYGFYLNGGVEPLPWLRLGGGLILYRGTEELSQGLNYLGGREGVGRLGTAGNALSYQVALELQPIRQVRIGLDYKHKGDMSLTGKGHFENPPVELASRGLVDQNVTHDLTFPNVLQIGAAVQALPNLLVTGSFTWDRFRVYDRDAFIGDRGFQIVVPRNYNNGYTFRLGGELAPTERLKVRLGVLRDVAPTPAEWLSATIPDSNVWAGSIGLGYAITRAVAIDFAFFHAFFADVTTPPSAAGQFNVLPSTYATDANIVSLGVKWTPRLARD
jgi:long-chain fatty acid transport protein